MSTPDANPAAPSAAPNPQAAFDSLTRTQQDHFMRTGELPEKTETPTDAPAASSPATPVKQASTDVQTDSSSDPTKAADSSPAKPEKRADPRATENRVPELLAERHTLKSEVDRLNRELAALRNPQPKPDDKSAPSAAAATPETFPSYEQALEKNPDLPYEQYLRDLTDHSIKEGIKKALAERDEATQREQARRTFSQQVIERTEQFVKRIEDAKAEDPKFWDGISDEVKQLKPLDDIRDPETGQWTERPTAYHFITQRVMESPDAAKYLKHFSDHPEDLHGMAKLLPDQVIERMAEIRVGWKHKPAAPAPKHVTDAPPPPHTLGKRPTTPTDAVEAAVASGNFAAFEAAQNARDLAARR